jgi:type VI secretion system VasD/TssJ family lipoprotein
MTHRRAFLVLPPALALLAIAGCASTPTGPVRLTLTVHAGDDQNPDPNGHATPVAVRLYQLTDTDNFERADFFALMTHEPETLGGELLGSEEFVVSPGTSRTITRTLASGTRDIGIAVLFRDIEQADWRATAPVPGGGETDLTLSISGRRAVLSSGGS